MRRARRAAHRDAGPSLGLVSHACSSRSHEGHEDFFQQKGLRDLRVFVNKPPLDSESQPDPRGGWRAGRVERGVHERELATDGRQRTGDEVARAGETGRPELGGGAVVMVEQVVDLRRSARVASSADSARRGSRRRRRLTSRAPDSRCRPAGAGCSRCRARTCSTRRSDRRPPTAARSPGFRQTPSSVCAGISGIRSPGSISMTPSRPLRPAAAVSFVLLPIRRPSRRSDTWRRGTCSRRRTMTRSVRVLRLELDALPPRLSEVLEIAEPGLRRRDEQDVVVVFGREEADGPAGPAFGDVPPRSPASKVLVTTWSSGGSPAIAFGSLQGWSGSAHPSSIDVGARLPSL